MPATINSLSTGAQPTDDLPARRVQPGGSPLTRMRAAGYISRARGYEIGENIAYGTLWLATPRSIVSSWMRSPGHRANILDGRYRDTAIGVATQLAPSLSHGQAGAVYTQDFGVVIRSR